ncbi:MerR family transcriptional regulator [Altererythrobacter arenosus]|uniref:MerR family transcriptional regulator n=1 Tax=Altererythrobacter arenosus TaxID=3032592 RepID=A0ABY8FNV8_9SPHN|nr:MerR family transcriptional regulator [Altererythrobacter sp. CAU 1644]WFL76547.1 MerR family transcriptional regulator [Altererythrobacter sp. CAU 1644]
MTQFNDGKDVGALRTIGEVGEALGIKAHVLRYWEQQFPMLKPLKRSGGRRYYRPEDVSLLETIDRLVNREGYTLKGAKAAIRAGKADAGAVPSPSAAPAAPSAAAQHDGPSVEDVVPQLKAIRARLEAILEA